MTFQQWAVLCIMSLTNINLGIFYVYVVVNM